MGILSFFNRGQKRARRLYGEARERIDAGAHEEALTIARKLRKLSYSGAFEIEGLAYAELGRHEDAVRVLREGLLHAPHVWLNWHLLGNCLSELGRFDEAMAAFDRAAACPATDHSYINLNRAVVAIRRGDYTSALTWLNAVHGLATQTARISTQLTALSGLGRNGEALDLGERTLREWSDTGRAGDERAIGEIASSVAELRRERGDANASIVEFAIDYWRATHHDKLLWIIRELNSMFSPSSTYFRLVLHAKMHADAPASRGFFITFDVVADTIHEAMQFVRELDDLENTADLTIEETAELGVWPEDPKGVYRVTGRVYYKEGS